MSRFIADLNKVLLKHESGTYANTSGNAFWIGQVTENTITDSENLQINRYLGTGSRQFDSINLGPRDVTGVLTYNPSDMMIPFFAIGSVTSVSGATTSVNTHCVTQISTDVLQNPWVSGTGQLNPPISFTIEDSKQAPGTGHNFVRTVKGVVPNIVTISAAQGDKVQVTVDWIGQTLEFTSGTTTSLTKITATPYLWSDCTLTLYDEENNASGLNTVKDFSFEINNNLEAPHYLNGSRDVSTPILGNKDYTLILTLDLTDTNSAMFYDKFYKGGSAFNFVIDMNRDEKGFVGSQHCIYYMSGCYVTTMENPSEFEGVTESSVEIKVQNVCGSEYSYSHNVPFGQYGPF